MNNITFSKLVNSEQSGKIWEDLTSENVSASPATFQCEVTTVYSLVLMSAHCDCAGDVLIVDASEDESLTVSEVDVGVATETTPSFT